MTPNPTCAIKAILAMNKINLTFTLVAFIREICSSPKGFAKKEGGGGNLKGGILTPLSTSVSLPWDDFLLKKEGEGIENHLTPLALIPHLLEWRTSTRPSQMSPFLKVEVAFYQVNVAKLVLVRV